MRLRTLEDGSKSLYSVGEIPMAPTLQTRGRSFEVVRANNPDSVRPLRRESARLAFHHDDEITSSEKLPHTAHLGIALKLELSQIGGFSQIRAVSSAIGTTVGGWRLSAFSHLELVKEHPS
jgi:hypothetical protein